MLVLSSPSGAGKTTISRALLAEDDDLTMSISATTRPKRPGEVDGRDYVFVNEPAFAEMVATDQLVEYATVFGNSYGTPRKPVEAVTPGQAVVCYGKIGGPLEQTVLGGGWILRGSRLD